jgi:hypothetical protein
MELSRGQMRSPVTSCIVFYMHDPRDREPARSAGGHIALPATDNASLESRPLVPFRHLSGLCPSTHVQAPFRHTSLLGSSYHYVHACECTKRPTGI